MRTGLDGSLEETVWKAYNTIREIEASFRVLKTDKEIVRIMNTQKAETTTTQNTSDETIVIRRCSEPNKKVQLVYNALRYKYAPFKKKSVVLKTDLKKSQPPDKQTIDSY